VKVKNGKVALSGTVGSAAERSQARIDAWVSGVTSVDTSGLEVRWWARDDMMRKAPPDSRSDEAIKKAVEDAFLYDPRVFSFNPNVEADNGVVTLTGEVEDLAAKRAAEDDARNTVGVWSVENYLRVRPAHRPSDADLVKKVRDAFARDPYVERHEITVSVLNGKAYLYGKVDSRFEKRHAEDVAARVAGVVAVSNAIRVDGAWSWRDDWEIRQDIASELSWSPFVDRDQVTVSVDDGVATLTGTVDNWHERSTAESNAWEGGAKDVRNRLRVRMNGSYYPPYSR
jgi:osmotically-inducible protein OsmY